MNHWRVWLILVVVVILGVGVYFFSAVLNNTQTYQGTELSGNAQDFQLTDQNGSMINFSDFRGKVVVLTFIDPKCQDTCPITAVHFREVHRQLNQEEAKQVVFLGVNVNVEASTVADMVETTRAWHLDEIPSWHLLTGSPNALEPVWKDYGVSAIHSHDSNSIMHTPGTFLIDPSGQKRWYISTVLPGEGNTDLTLSLSDLLLKHIREILQS